jgi:hypothetical protein
MWQILGAAFLANQYPLDEDKTVVLSSKRLVIRLKTEVELNC